MGFTYEKNTLEICDNMGYEKALDIILDNIATRKDVLKCLNNIKTFSKDLFKHSLNVGFLSVVVGDLFLNEEELTEIFFAASLHDYGKLKISKSIIDKPDVLTVEEREKMNLHPLLGYITLRQETNLSKYTLFGVLDHHEKNDGNGYLNKKNADEINLYGKIITLADVFDAMVTNRVYRKGIPKDIVCEFIRENIGNHFDSDIATIFLEHVYGSDFEYEMLKLRNKIADLIEEGEMIGGFSKYR